MRIIAGVVGACGVALGCAFGCSFGDLDGLSKGTPDASSLPDAPSGTEAAAPVADAGTQAPEAGTVGDAAPTDAGPLRNSCGALLFGTEIPLVNGDFELGCSTGWGTYVADRTEQTTPVSHGVVSCSVCGSFDGPDGFFIYQDVPLTMAANEVYEVVGCIRTVPSAPVAVNVGAAVEVGQGAGPGDHVSLTDTFQQIRAAYTIPAPATSMRIVVGGNQVGGDCLLLDDVRLFRTQ